MKKRVATGFFCVMQFLGFAQASEEFVDAGDDSIRTESVQSSEPAAPDLCVGDVCIGDDISVYEKILDITETPLPSSIEEYRKREYSKCEESRLQNIENIKKLEREGTITSQQVQLFIQIKGLGNNTNCVNWVKDLVKTAEESRGKVREFLNTWAELKAADADVVLASHPEASVGSEVLQGKAAGILEIFAKNQFGSYKDVMDLANSCQPIVLTGSVNEGKVMLMALNDPSTGKFPIIYLKTIFSGLTVEQVAVVRKKYYEKFGNNYKHLYDFKYDLGDLIISVYHPRLKSELVRYYEGEGLLDDTDKTRGQFAEMSNSGTRIYEMKRPYSELGERVSRSYGEYAHCKAIHQKLSDVDIR